MKTTSPPILSRHLKRAADGRCVRCGACRPEAGRQCCKPCDEKNKLRNRIKAKRCRDRRRAAGLCVMCGKKKVDGPLYCPKCQRRGRAYTRKWRTENPGRVAKSNRRYRDWHWRVRLEVIAAYGGRCACCNESEPLLLTIDHTNGDGKSHRLKIKQRSIYPIVKREGFPRDRYRLLCFNCNIGTHHNGGVCPHKQRNYP